MDATKSNEPAGVLYFAPKPELLDSFARRVCVGLGVAHDDHEVMEGFSHFLQLAVDIQVKQLNREAGHVDNRA